MFDRLTSPSPDPDSAQAAAGRSRTWNRRSARWPGIWPRRPAGSWSCWPSSTPAKAGPAGTCRPARPGCRGSASWARAPRASTSGWPGRWPHCRRSGASSPPGGSPMPRCARWPGSPLPTAMRIWPRWPSPTSQARPGTCRTPTSTRSSCTPLPTRRSPAHPPPLLRSPAGATSRTVPRSVVPRCSRSPATRCCRDQPRQARQRAGCRSPPPRAAPGAAPALRERDKCRCRFLFLANYSRFLTDGTRVQVGEPGAPLTVGCCGCLLVWRWRPYVWSDGPWRVTRSPRRCRWSG